jgi:hypothetical protein
MQISMYGASAPVLARALRNLSAILRKGEACAAERKIDPSVLLNYRLAPDMYTLTKQVQIATDMSKGCVSRLAGVDIPSYEDKEATFGELIARIEKCVAYVESFKPEQIDGTEDKPITLKFPNGEYAFTGLAYLQGFVLPNVYFHATTAYAILRHCGLPLSKLDFIGSA